MPGHTIYVNGVRYNSKLAFIHTIKEGNPRYVLKELTAAIANGEPLIYKGRFYVQSLLPPMPRHIPQPEHELVRTQPAPRRLLAREHATCGLHQDRGRSSK